MRARGAIDAPVGWVLLPLLLAACSHTRGATRQPASGPWTARPDVAALARIWRGDAASCGQARRGRPSIPTSRQRDCSVDGWQSVVLSWTVESEGSRTLEAHAE